MTQITVTLPKMYRDSELLPGLLRTGLEQGLAMAGEEGRGIVGAAIRNASPHPVIDTGLMVLGQAWELNIALGQLQARVRIGPEPPVLTRTVVMEHGRRPGGRLPPPEALAAWALRKGLVTGFTRQGRRRRLRNEQALAASMGWRIAKSIRRKGIKARGFYAKSIPLIRKRSRELIAQRLGVVLRGGLR